MFLCTHNSVVHDIGSRCSARHTIHVSCAWVVVRFDLSSTLHFALSTVSPIFNFILLIFIFTFWSLTLWSTTPLSQVTSPNSSTTTTSQRPLKSSSSDSRPSNLHDSEISDYTIGRALSSPMFTQEREEPAGRRQAYHSPEESLLSSQSFSVGHVRTWRPVDEFGSLISNVRENPCRDWENEQIRILLERQKSRFSLTEQRLRNTSSRPIMTEDVSINWMELSSLNEEKLIVLMQETNNNDEINFFMNNYWNKIENFLKLMRKVSMGWKNWSDFKDLRSIHFQEENYSKIETLSLNSQPRFRNYRMKLIAWMIREIQKMLNQYAVDNPTLPVNLRFSHLFKILAEC